ncbi:hypothetical protein HFD88_001883 [Aspergillus terreus]|nr:hypothetical protein HFD88_001883 [Aspergillus terreus]
MDSVTAVAKVALYYPLYYLFLGLLRILSFTFQILLTPVTIVGRVGLYFILLPWRFLVKFQAILTFLAVASVIGIITGVILHLTTDTIVELIHKMIVTPSPAFSADYSIAESASGDAGSSSDYEFRRKGRELFPRGGSISPILEEEEEI